MNRHGEHGAENVFEIQKHRPQIHRVWITTADAMLISMLRDNARSCDVCGAAIAKGERYVVSVVPKDKVPLFEAMMATRPHLVPTTILDSNGNLRLDICLDCRFAMGTGTEMVN